MTVRDHSIAKIASGQPAGGFGMPAPTTTKKTKTVV